MNVLESLKHTVTQALKRVASPAEPDIAMLKLLEYKDAQPCRNRSGNKPKGQKTKNRAKAKAAAKARKANK